MVDRDQSVDIGADQLGFAASQITQLAEVRRETLLFFGAFIAGIVFVVGLTVQVPAESPVIESAAEFELPDEEFHVDPVATQIRERSLMIALFVTLASGLILWRFMFLFREFTRYCYQYAFIAERYADLLPAGERHLLNFDVAAIDARRLSYSGFSTSCVWLTIGFFCIVTFGSLCLVFGNIQWPAMVTGLLCVLLCVLVPQIHRRAIDGNGWSDSTGVIRSQLDEVKKQCRSHMIASLGVTRKDLTGVTYFFAFLLLGTLQQINDIDTAARSYPEEESLTLGVSVLMSVATLLLLNLYLHLNAWESRLLVILDDAPVANRNWMVSNGPLGYLLCSCFSVAAFWILFAELPDTATLKPLQTPLRLVGHSLWLMVFVKWVVPWKKCWCRATIVAGWAWQQFRKCLPGSSL
jgi:hypothetical protein